jgi:hypothetical protein
MLEAFGTGLCIAFAAAWLFAPLLMLLVVVVLVLRVDFGANPALLFRFFFKIRCCLRSLSGSPPIFHWSHSSFTTWFIGVGLKTMRYL